MGKRKRNSSSNYKDNSSEIFKEILNTEVNSSSEDSDIEMDWLFYRKNNIPGNTFPILKRFQTQNFSPEN